MARQADGSPVSTEVAAATAGLLVALAESDDAFDPPERLAIEKGLRDGFGITRDEAGGWIDEAWVPASDAALGAVADQIRDEFDPAQRQRILGLLWTVVYADQVVDDAEVAFVARVAPLLGVTPEQSLEARRHAFQWFSSIRRQDED